LLGGIYESLQGEIDTLGELLRTLGEFMPCDIQDVIDDSNIDTTELEGKAETYLEAVKSDLEQLVAEHRELIVIATEEHEDQIANYAQDRVLALSKQIWMLDSTLS
jgi:DNA-binding ferritin-like protein